MVIELDIMYYVDRYELLVRTVRYCVFVLVKVLDQCIPLVCDVFRSACCDIATVDLLRVGIDPASISTLLQGEPCMYHLSS